VVGVATRKGEELLDSDALGLSRVLVLNLVIQFLLVLLEVG